MLQYWLWRSSEDMDRQEQGLPAERRRGWARLGEEHHVHQLRAQRRQSRLGDLTMHFLQRAERGLQHF